MLATALVAQLAYRVHVAALRLRDGSCYRVWATSHCWGFCPLLFAAFSPEKHGGGSLYVCEKLRFEVSCEIMLFYESAWELDVVAASCCLRIFGLMPLVKSHLYTSALPAFFTAPLGCLAKLL